MITKRECDIPMARSKKLLPCDKDCKNCMACIETTDTGERRHCARHKNSNVLLDMKIAMIGMEFEGTDDTSPSPKEERKKMDRNRRGKTAVPEEARAKLQTNCN